MKASLTTHFIFAGGRDAVASLALVARLCATRNEDLCQLREAINGASNPVSGLLGWLDHAVGWEQDRRAGYYYPLRGPTEDMRDVTPADRIAATELLEATFRENSQVAALTDLVIMIFGLGEPNRLTQEHRDGHKVAA